MRSAVVTIVRGRHEHLRRQRDGLARMTGRPDAHIVVAMGDPSVRTQIDVRTRLDPTLPTQVLELAVPAGAELPLAAARNAGAAHAIAGGAELLIFLDVDCIPGPTLLSRYAAAAADPAHANALLCGPVAYLPAAGESSYDLDRLADLAEPHPAQPRPADGAIVVATDRRLFWSLSFAVLVSAWERVGGFCTDYTGYGGEDTDFAQVAASAGVGMRWVGGATTYHQYHPVSAPPVEHVTAIVRNARVFHARWGWWPMLGWLQAFADLGLVSYDEVTGWHELTPVSA